MNRRNFLRACAAVSCGLALAHPLPALAVEGDFRQGVRQLELYRPDTKEHLSLAYLQDGKWLPDAYAQLCWILRDIQANQSVQMDTTLIAILDWTQQFLARYGYTEPLHVLSGFRTMETNRRTKGASTKSQHLYGKAVDFRVPGLSTEYLGRLMAWLSKGGVGVYSRNGFVHVDTGPIRTFEGRILGANRAPLRG